MGAAGVAVWRGSGREIIKESAVAIRPPRAAGAAGLPDARALLENAVILILFYKEPQWQQNGLEF